MLLSLLDVVPKHGSFDLTEPQDLSILKFLYPQDNEYNLAVLLNLEKELLLYIRSSYTSLNFRLSGLEVLIMAFFLHIP